MGQEGINMRSAVVALVNVLQRAKAAQESAQSVSETKLALLRQQAAREALEAVSGKGLLAARLALWAGAEK